MVAISFADVCIIRALLYLSSWSRSLALVYRIVSDPGCCLDGATGKTALVISLWGKFFPQECASRK